MGKKNMASQCRRRSLTHSKRPQRLGVLALLSALAVIGAACGDGADPERVGSVSGERGNGKKGAAGGPSIDITAPKDGAKVGTSFKVEIDSSVPFGETETGRHHLHLYFDGNTTQGAYPIIYNDDPYTVTQLAPGKHTIEARIANADHSHTDARYSITVTVRKPAGSKAKPPSEPKASKPKTSTNAKATSRPKSASTTTKPRATSKPKPPSKPKSSSKPKATSTTTKATTTTTSPPPGYEY